MHDKPHPPRPLTLAEASSAIRAAPGIPEGGRRSMLSALNFYARLVGPLAPERIPFEAETVIDTMAKASARALGVSEDHLRNMRAALRAVLRKLGLLLPVRRSTGPLQAAAWRDLAAELSSTHHPHRLRAFMGYCDARGMLPDAVTPETLETYLAEQIASKGGANCHANAAEVARLWNRYAAEVAIWPSIHLGLKPATRPRAPAYDTYPAALQADVTRFLEGAGPPPIGKLFGDVGLGPDGALIVRPVLSAATIETRRKGVRLLLWGAIATGTASAEIIDLELLIEPAMAARVLEWHHARLGQPNPTAGLAMLADTLVAIAAYKGQTGPRQQALRSLLRQARPKRQSEMSESMAALITVLEQRRPRSLVLHAPSALMAEARRLRDGYTASTGQHHAPAPARAAWLAAIAVAIEIELHLPLRIGDLAALHLDRHLAVLEGPRRSRSCRLTVLAHKNGVRVETEMAGESAALLLEYIEDFRSQGPHPETRWLFPHRDQPDASRPEGHFSEAISEQLRRLTGIEMHVHAFRAFAALLVVEQTPHAFDDIRALLGHKNFETAWRFYMRHNRIAAGARLSETISRQRRDLAVQR